MALVVFLQEDENVLSMNRNLKIFCETAPSYTEIKMSIAVILILSIYL